MSTFGDALKGMRDLLLMQRDVQDLEQAVSDQRKEFEDMSDQIIDIDKRLYALERIIDLGARQSRQSRSEPPRIEE